MRALVKTRPGPGLEFIDVPDPDCGPREVKIRVLRAGLCGTDLHIDSWDDWAQATITPGLILGHEFFGEVVEVGPDVRSVHVGQRASGEGHIVCGRCRNCRAGLRQLCIRTQGIGVHRAGAFADYVVIPETNVWVQPEDLDPDVGAVFDPLGNATHTTLMFPLVGEDVVITGAGPIGLMSAAIARHVGARHIVVTDVSPFRLGLARGAGADLALDVRSGTLADAQAQLGMREGFDVGLEMSGSPAAMGDMVANMNHGGKIAMLGLPADRYAVDWSRIITHMLTIKGVYGREMYDTWYKMSAMLATSPALLAAVSSVITHRLPVAEWAEGFAAASTGDVGKVVLDFT
ncbi:MAG: L-threonine 3-dehydrogenase [Nostocoides sp.]